MSEQIEFPGTLGELLYERQQLMSKLEAIEASIYKLRSEQPLEGTWEPHVKRQLAELRFEKRGLESRISRLNAQIKKLNIEERANSSSAVRAELTTEQLEESLRRKELFKQAKLRLVSSIVYDNPHIFLHKAASLLASLAKNFERGDLSEEEWAIVKVFPEIMTQPRG